MSLTASRWCITTVLAVSDVGDWYRYTGRLLTIPHRSGKLWHVRGNREIGGSLIGGSSVAVKIFDFVAVRNGMVYTKTMLSQYKYNAREALCSWRRAQCKRSYEAN